MLAFCSEILIPTSAVVYHCFTVHGIISSHFIELTSLLADLDIILSENPVAKHTSFNPVGLYNVTIGFKYFGLVLLILN